MIEQQKDQFLWVEKYRPQNIDDCILPDALKKTFKDYVAQGQLPHMLLCGTAGIGKTTIAKALCNEIGAEYIILNGSDTGGHIDTLRTTIKGFATSVSLTDSKKVVILDEADYLQANSTQPALRNYMEEFSANCRFIFTCNYKNKIIEPLHSRCAVVEFKIETKDKQQIAAQFFKRATQILKQEGVEFDPKVVAELVTKHFPDWRRVLNELQRYSVSGKIDSGILVNMSHDSFKQLVGFMKDRDFTEVRKWVAKNADADTTALFREFYDNAMEYIEPSTIPNLVLVLADYQYKAAFVADHELNIMAAMTELMVQCKFK
jgi:DNA polymerase III delta prime subunit